MGIIDLFLKAAIFLAFFGISIQALYVQPQLFSLRNHFHSQCGMLSFNCSVVELKVASINLNSLLDKLESSDFEKMHASLRKKTNKYYVVMNISTSSPDLLNSYKAIDEFISV